MTEHEIFEEIIESSRLCYDRGLVTALGGNVSVKYDDKIYITATNVALNRVTPDNIVICDLDGNPLPDCKCKLKPSKEIITHVQMYRLRPQAKSVVHVHPPYIVAFTLKNQPIPMVTGTARAKVKEIPVIKFATSSSPALLKYMEETIVPAAEDIHTFAMAEHGSIAWDESAYLAFCDTEVAEDTARIAYLAGYLN